MGGLAALDGHWMEVIGHTSPPSPCTFIPSLLLRAKPPLAARTCPGGCALPPTPPPTTVYLPFAALCSSAFFMPCGRLDLVAHWLDISQHSCSPRATGRATCHCTSRGRLRAFWLIRVPYGCCCICCSLLTAILLLLCLFCVLDGTRLVSMMANQEAVV